MGGRIRTCKGLGFRLYLVICVSAVPELGLLVLKLFVAFLFLVLHLLLHLLEFRK